MAELMYVRLESSPEQGWYAYFEGEPTEADFKLAQTSLSHREEAPLGLETDSVVPTEVEPSLSTPNYLKRFYVGYAA